MIASSVTRPAMGMPVASRNVSANVFKKKVRAAGWAVCVRIVWRRYRVRWQSSRVCHCCSSADLLLAWKTSEVMTSVLGLACAVIGHCKVFALLSRKLWPGRGRCSGLGRLAPRVITDHLFSLAIAL